MENKIGYQMRVLQFDDVIKALKTQAYPQRESYLAMFSTWYGGIIKDPQLMFVPIDDHIVHRGDGVFEAIKCLNGKVYALDRHLERIKKSADLIGIKLPFEISQIREIAMETVRAANAPDVLLRLYISRGPGGFTTNPYECIASQMYLVITSFKPYPVEKYQKGVSAKVSEIAVKEGIFATVKSCNYLPNVMMKKEAIDSGVDFTVSKDEQGYLAEGSTENFAIVNHQGELLVPGFQRTLRGVTAVRAMELAEDLRKSGLIQGVRNDHIRIDEVFRAREAMFFGTTLDCLPVSRFENQLIQNGEIGPVCKRLLQLIQEDMVTGPLVSEV